MSTYSNDPLGYYAILGLPYNAGDEEIKRSYREQAKRWHPDHNTDPAAVETFQKISVAYDVISDDEQRLIFTVTDLVIVTRAQTFGIIFLIAFYTAVIRNDLRRRTALNRIKRTVADTAIFAAAAV